MDSKKTNSNRSAFSKGFTLVEMLLVVSLIALLIALLLPALGRARAAAQTTVCFAQLGQWTEANYMYMVDNNGSFWEDRGHDPSGVWMVALAPYYGNIDTLRVCPSADTQSNFFGSTFKTWGPNMQAHGFRPEDYGSYGINHWINPLKGWDGWRGQPSWQWRRVKAMQQPNETPLIGDCAWYGGNPTSVGSSGGMIPPSADFTETFQGWQYDMARFCLPRHNDGLNMAFGDGSVENISLERLWELRWHKMYVPTQIELPW